MPEKTIMEIRAELAAIRDAARRKMEREIARRSEPLLAELAELTAFARMHKRRGVRLSSVAIAQRRKGEAKFKARELRDAL